MPPEGDDVACSKPCRVDEHYLTISQPDGSMNHTVHVEPEQIAELMRYAGPDQLVVYRQIARESLVRIDPPDRPAPQSLGCYVVTPPASAAVSAASIVRITKADRAAAWRAFKNVDEGKT
jgi:hypothetical protein